MSSAAPIKENKSLKDAFVAAPDTDNFGFIHCGVNIKTSVFELYSVGKAGNNDDETWKEMMTQCKAKQHTFFIVKDPENKKLFKLIHYAPDQSPVNQRMIYASSRKTLKNNLGNALFSNDLHITSPDELNLTKLLKAKQILNEVDVRTEQEIEYEENAYDASAKSSRSQLMKKLPMNFSENLKTAIAKYKNGKTKTVIAKLSNDQKSFDGDISDIDNINDLREILDETVPLFLLFEYTNKKITKKIFCYFCPEKANRKLKFNYSTVRNNLVDYCIDEAKITFDSRIEMSTIKDCSTEFLNYHCFPQKIVTETFKKPKPRGKKRTKKRKSLTKLNMDEPVLNVDDQKE